jgi:heat shock protein HslJ
MGATKRSGMFLCAISLLVACATATPSPTASAEPFDATGNWVLESGLISEGAIPILADFPITLSIDGAQVSGTAACNGYGGHLELVNGFLQIGELSAETALCGGDPDGEVMRSESAFIQALGRISAGHGEADRLTLSGPTTRLEFRRLPPLPTSQIVGTDWLLESMVDGGVASVAIGEPAMLRLEADGTFHGSTGCRTFTGTWIEAAGQLVATQAGMEGECPSDLVGQDGAIIQAFDGSIPTIAAERLTLTMKGGIGLVYRRATP